MRKTPSEIGELIRHTRRQLKLTQKELALTTGTGLRFIIDLEKGKPTCEIGKSLIVLQTLGIALTLTPPSVDPVVDNTLKRRNLGTWPGCSRTYRLMKSYICQMKLFEVGSGGPPPLQRGRECAPSAHGVKP